jgi:hypothetical protein
LEAEGVEVVTVGLSRPDGPKTIEHEADSEFSNKDKFLAMAC